MSTDLSEDLRDRVDEELKYFNEALAAAQQNETPQNFENLADAADRRLMRSVGRVLVEAKRPLGEGNA